MLPMNRLTVGDDDEDAENPSGTRVTPVLDALGSQDECLHACSPTRGSART